MVSGELPISVYRDLGSPNSVILLVSDILPWRGGFLTDELKNLDLSTKSFDQFVEFFFNRVVLPDEKQFDYYLTDLAGERYDEGVPSSPAIVVEHMTMLFVDFGLIAAKYSLAQLDQGIWGIFGENLRFGAAYSMHSFNVFCLFGFRLQIPRRGNGGLF